MRRQRLLFLTIVALFLLPVLAAWLWHANIDRWHPRATMNHGELVTPVRPLTAFDLQNLAGERITLDDLRHKWTLVYIGPAECMPACRNNLYKMRQVRLALNDKMDRVQRLWVISDATRADALRGLLGDYPGMMVSVQDGAKRERFIAQFAIHAGEAPASAQRIYVIDPLGNLMMSYPVDAQAKGMLKDLERLLMTSWVG